MNGFFYNFVPVKPLRTYIGVVFSVLLLLLPFQNTVAQQQLQKKSCCGSEMSSCCSSKKQNHTDRKHKSSNTCDDCCNALQHCSGSYTLTAVRPDSDVNLRLKRPYKKGEFHYQIPSLASLNFNIWQPPKIG